MNDIVERLRYGATSGRSAAYKLQTEAADEIERLRAEVAGHQRKFSALLDDYENACKLVADMHAAAMGAKVGPRLGVVEDVAAVRSENDALRAEVAGLREALRKIAAWDDEWGAFPEANNPAWGAMAIVTAREVFPEPAARKGTT